MGRCFVTRSNGVVGAAAPWRDVAARASGAIFDNPHEARLKSLLAPLAPQKCERLGIPSHLKVGNRTASALVMYNGTKRCYDIGPMRARHPGWTISRYMVPLTSCRGLLAAIPKDASVAAGEDVTIVVCMLDPLWGRRAICRRSGPDLEGC